MYHFKDGSRYEGNWRNNHRSGLGTLFLSGVSEYEGTWSDGKSKSSGSCTSKTMSTERNRVDSLQGHTSRVLRGGASTSMRHGSALGKRTIPVGGAVRRR